VKGIIGEKKTHEIVAETKEKLNYFAEDESSFGFSVGNAISYF